MIHTRAAVLRDPSGKFSIEEIVLEELLPDEILVRITAAGMCHSDQGGRREGQFLPAVLGHEGAGVVERTGSAVSDLATGDHVILSYDACRICDRCRAGAPYHCKHFFEFNGVSRVDEHRVKARDSGAAPVAASWFGQSSFACHAIVKATSAVRVPDDVPLDILSPLGCGFQTGIGSVVNGLGVGQGASIAIFGAGAVGLAAVIGGVLAGAEDIVAIDVVSARLKLATEVGATRTIDATRDNWQRELGSWDFTLDTTGVPHLMHLAIQSLAPGGKCGLIGATDKLTLNPRILSGRSLTFLVEGHSDPHDFIPRMVEWWRAGKLPLERLVARYPLDKINDAEQDSARGAVVKPVLIPQHLEHSLTEADEYAHV
jgi:aryl-alcohol dehydrogenase